MTSRTQSGWGWAHWPLNRIFFGVTATVLVFLALVLALGIRQYLLYRQCQQAVATSDHLLFQFTAIKDHLNESLILGTDVNMQAFNSELQNLEKETEALTGNILVPEGLKGTLPSRVALVGLEVRLRSIQDQRADKTREIAELARALNGINIDLQQFRFHLTDYTQTILIGLHKIIAGSLGLIVALTCTLLILLNRHLAAPILALCRLTAPKRGEEEEGNTECSLYTLIKRITDLLAKGDVRAEGTGDSEFPAPGKLERDALCYRYAVTGSIGSELACELTNSVNGVLNYTQSLIDIGEQGNERQQATRLYPSLLKEVQKTAHLVAALQRVGQWQSAPATSVSLQKLFGMLALVLEKPLRAEAIVLSLPVDCPFGVSVLAGDLWLVLLTLIQQGRRVLNHALPGNPAEKWLRLECTIPPGEPRRLVLTLTNSAAAWNAERGCESIWPSPAFCTHLLQQHQGTLDNAKTPEGTRLILDLPYRSSAA